MKLPLPISESQITDFCKRWHVLEMAVFGSVLRPDFHDSSDIDILVSFKPGCRVTLFDMIRMKTELEQLSGRTVDLVSKRGLESSRNPIRKRSILNSIKVIYGA